ncbi:FecR family protein [Rubritalea squalenifaciens DSM 18772]|uniref:FecR family protein n=1 Tax=Rubritalea squalenifaciens DSM 18772 TaxID=1123071 RepID=A0A1M6DP84_9BACT|nr:FecR domain-containing protein [Rubritalea squalenifaciens]SHI75012.1 FecR family protein [Rubritalea squalenifaciens DSM 18772]
MSAPSPELRNLIDLLLIEEPLTREQMAHLEDLLEDDQNLAYYVETMQQEAMLPEGLSMTTAAPQAVKPSKHLRISAIAALAACLTFFIGLYIGLQQDGSPDISQTSAPAPTYQPEDLAKPAMARITGLVGVRWDNETSNNLLATQGEAEQLTIKSGLMEITYASGVKLTIEGPAKYAVTSATSGHLTQGKLVASVPKGAEGFQIDYAKGKIVDLGTEFALNLQPNKAPEIGVFDGEIEVHTKNNTKPVSLYENQAVRQEPGSEQEEFTAIPFNRDAYVRKLPSRDFAWEMHSPNAKEKVFDVSHLVWKAASYRAIFKWINGHDGVSVRNVELRLDGKLIASDNHLGHCGALRTARDSIFALDIDEDRFQNGKWTLHAWIEALPRKPGGATGPYFSSGILQFEEGLVSEALAEDFTGKWSYRHLGRNYIRHFKPDGTIMLYSNGVHLKGSFRDSTWSVSNGILRVNMPHDNAYEDHVLRDKETLIFVNQPYENAKKIP